MYIVHTFQKFKNTGRYCDVFSDCYGSPVVGIRWKKLPFGPSKFTVAHAAYTAPAGAAGEQNGSSDKKDKKDKKKKDKKNNKDVSAVVTTVEPNVSSIVHHMELVGKGLVLGVYGSYEDFGRACTKH